MKKKIVYFLLCNCHVHGVLICVLMLAISLSKKKKKKDMKQLPRKLFALNLVDYFVKDFSFLSSDFKIFSLFSNKNNVKDVHTNMLDINGGG